MSNLWARLVVAAGLVCCLVGLWCLSLSAEAAQQHRAESGRQRVLTIAATPPRAMRAAVPVASAAGTSFGPPPDLLSEDTAAAEATDPATPPLPSRPDDQKSSSLVVFEQEEEGQQQQQQQQQLRHGRSNNNDDSPPLPATATTSTTTPPGKRPGWAFVCITGQLSRLELASKLRNLVRPLAAQYNEVEVSLALTAGDEMRYTNIMAGIDSSQQAPSPFTLASAKKALLAAGATSVGVQEPEHDSTIAVNEQFFTQLDKKNLGLGYRTRRAENHIRQFEALQACMAGLRQHTQPPQIAFRLRDDAYLINADIESLADEIATDGRDEKLVLVQGLRRKGCAAWGGMNDKMAVVSGAAAPLFFTAPLDLYHRKNLASWVKNPETYYLDTYHIAGLSVKMSSGFQALTARQKQHGGCWKFIPRGVARCERYLVKLIADAGDDGYSLPCAARGEVEPAQDKIAYGRSQVENSESLQQLPGPRGSGNNVTIGGEQPDPPATTAPDDTPGIAASSLLQPPPAASYPSEQSGSTMSAADMNKHADRDDAAANIGGDAWAYICVTGQLARLELASKIKHLVVPLAQIYPRVHVGLALVAQPQDDTDNEDHDEDSSPAAAPAYDAAQQAQVDGAVASAAATLSEAGAATVHAAASTANGGQLRALDVCKDDVLDEASAGALAPDIVVHVSDDAFVVKLDVIDVINHLKQAATTTGKPTVVTSACIAKDGSGTSSELAFATAGTTGALFFESPLPPQDQAQDHGVGEDPKDVGAFILTSYKQRGWSMTRSASLLVVRASLQMHHGCWAFIPRGAGACQKAAVSMATDSGRYRMPCVVNAPAGGQWPTPTLAAPDEQEAAAADGRRAESNLSQRGLDMLSVEAIARHTRPSPASGAAVFRAGSSLRLKPLAFACITGNVTPQNLRSKINAVLDPLQSKYTVEVALAAAAMSSSADPSTTAAENRKILREHGFKDVLQMEEENAESTAKASFEQLAACANAMASFGHPHQYDMIVHLDASIKSQGATIATVVEAVKSVEETGGIIVLGARNRAQPEQGPEPPGSIEFEALVDPRAATTYFTAPLLECSARSVSYTGCQSKQLYEDSGVQVDKSEGGSAPGVDIYVISLQGVPGAPAENNGRLDAFQRDWAGKCGAAIGRIHRCAGAIDKRRGFGLTRGFISCIDQAIANTSPDKNKGTTPTAIDRTMALFFEDDARLFDSDFCRSDHRAKLWSAAPKDTFLVMLGGHHWRVGLTRAQGFSGTNFQEVTRSYGTYGFAVPRQNLAKLRSGFARLAESSADWISPDKDWYRYAEQGNQRIYALEPLAVFHPAGFSNTWGKKRDTIAGRRVRDRLLIGVTTSIKSFATRAKAIASTWGNPKALRHFDGINLLFFVGEDALEAVRSDLCARAGIAPEAVVGLPGIRDQEYPPVHKTTAMLQHMAALVGGSEEERRYEWVMKVEDDTLVNLRTVTETLARLHAPPDQELLYLGQRGYGRRGDRLAMDLKRPFCMGGPGYVLSAAAIARVGPTMRSCATRMKRQSDVTPRHWHSDVIIGKCIYESLDIGCWDEPGPLLAHGFLRYNDRYFVQRYEGTEFPQAAALARAWTIHPLKDPKVMRKMYKDMLKRPLNQAEPKLDQTKPRKPRTPPKAAALPTTTSLPLAIPYRTVDEQRARIYGSHGGESDGGGISSAPNAILSRAAFVIKTYNRPGCLIQLLNSLLKFAPWLHVIVGDDSTNGMLGALIRKTKGFARKPTYIRLPVDSGVGYGRQRLVKKAHDLGFEYLIMSDDDFVIPDGNLLPRMAQAFKSANADVLSPVRCEKHNGHCGRGEIASIVRSNRNELIVIPNVTRVYPDDQHNQHPVLLSSLPPPHSIASKYDCRRSDLVQQFFLAKVDALLHSGWDDKLKNNDHYDAMLSMKEANLRLFTCRKLPVLHAPGACTGQSADSIKYKRVRKSRWAQLMPYVLKKWNASALYDEVGRRWSINEKGETRTQCGVGCFKFPQFAKLLPGREGHENHASRAEKDKRSFVRTARIFESAINAQRPFWETLRVPYPGQSGAILLARKHLSPCMDAIQGSIRSSISAVRSPNDSEENNPPPPLSTSIIYNIRPCDSIDSFMRTLPMKRSVPLLQVLPKPKLYYVMAVSDPEEDLEHVLNDLSNDVALSSVASVSVLIVAMGTGFNEQWEELIRSYLNDFRDARRTTTSGIQLHILHTLSPFRRATGLKMGYQHIQTVLEPVRDHHDNSGDVVLFSFDATLRIPLGFSRQIMRSVHCKVSAYAPVHVKNNLWMEANYTNIGICLSDYVRLPLEQAGWRKRWWDGWGTAEDMDMVQRVQEMLVVHRPKVIGFEHYRKDILMMKDATINEELQSSDPRRFPVVPVTEVENDGIMREKLIEFIRREDRGKGEAVEDFEEVIWRTRMRPIDNTMVYTLWERKSGAPRMVTVALPEIPVTR